MAGPQGGGPRPGAADAAARQARAADAGRQAQQQKVAADSRQASQRTADAQKAAAKAADVQRRQANDQQAVANKRTAERQQQQRTSDAQRTARKAADVQRRVVDRRHGPADTYARPTHFRKGVPEAVWTAAIESRSRQVRDPVTGRFMSASKPWDMGHRPGDEFRKHQDSARTRGISRADFLNEHNMPERYRPELGSSNRSRRGERMDNYYYGP